MTNSTMQALLCIARSILEGVLDEVAGHKRTVEDVDNSVRSSYVPLVASWIGEDADAFRDDVNTRLLPAIARLIAAILGMSNGIIRAREIIEETDNRCVGLAEDLAGTFKAIY
jgi:WXG100 family type VII secretion target